MVFVVVAAVVEIPGESIKGKQQRPVSRRSGAERKTCPLGEQSQGWASLLLPLCSSALSKAPPELTLEVLGVAVMREEARSCPYLQYIHLPEDSTQDSLNNHVLRLL